MSEENVEGRQEFQGRGKKKGRESVQWFKSRILGLDTWALHLFCVPNT